MSETVQSQPATPKKSRVKTGMFQRILFPIDGEDDELTALYVSKLAKMYKASVIVMHAYEVPLLRRRASLVAEDLRASLEADGKEYVAEVSTLLQKEGISVEGLVIEGNLTDAVAHAIEEAKPDLVVMGAPNENILNTLGLGSVVSRIVSHSSVPVLVVK